MILLKPAASFASKVQDRFRPPGGKLPGYSMGFHKANLIRFEKSQTSLWTGFNGHGKSLFLNQLMLTAIADYSEKFIVASLEMLPDRNLMRTARQITHKTLPEPDEITQCLEWCSDSIQFYDSVGSADIPTLLENFEYGIEYHGTTSIIIDSLMKMGFDEDEYSKQKKFVEEMSNFAMRHNIHMHIVAHSRKDKNESYVPGKMDVMGAGGITNIVDAGFTVWRNKAKEKKIDDLLLSGNIIDHALSQEYDALIDCWKCRDNGENEKSYAMWFDRCSLQYMESKNHTPRDFACDDAPF